MVGTQKTSSAKAAVILAATTVLYWNLRNRVEAGHARTIESALKIAAAATAAANTGKPSLKIALSNRGAPGTTWNPIPTAIASTARFQPASRRTPPGSAASVRTASAAASGMNQNRLAGCGR